MAEAFTVEDLQRLYTLFSQGYEEMKWSPYPRFILEATIIKAVNLPKLKSLEDIVAKLSTLKNFTPSCKQEEVLPSESPVAPEPTPKSPSSTPIRLEEWERVIQRLKEIKPNIASFLEQGKVLEIKEEELTIGFNDSTAFFIDRLQKEDTNRFIHTILQETLQKDLKLNFVRLIPNSITVPDGRKDKAKEQTPPFLKEVLEVFEGRVVDIKGRNSYVKEDA